ncbi:16634_t:CDS:2 [Entrophospora sp. SA101]|nr:16634_t:CDS:2 [Entrophospora sp. SA101]CAJ0830077.1 11538_t:CDS:2 [Entrophospora sp. SA101]
MILINLKLRYILYRKHRRNSNNEDLGDSEFDETNQKVNEVDNYLDENITEQAGPNTDTFEWWNENFLYRQY